MENNGKTWILEGFDGILMGFDGDLSMKDLDFIMRQLFFLRDFSGKSNELIRIDMNGIGWDFLN